MQAPPTIGQRIERSDLVVFGRIRSTPGGGRHLIVDEVAKGDPAAVPELDRVALPPLSS